MSLQLFGISSSSITARYFNRRQARHHFVVQELGKMKGKYRTYRMVADIRYQEKVFKFGQKRANACA